MVRIAVVDMSGSRNRGCEALVRGALDALHSFLPRGRCQLDLHTEDPTFDRSVFRDAFDGYYRQYPLLFPRHGHNAPRNRLLYTGLAQAERFAPGQLSRFRSISAMKAADLLIVTGGDILTSDYDVFPGYASVMHLGKPVAILGHTIGPFAPADEAYFRKSLKDVVLCTVRESLSYEYLQKVSPDLKVTQAADLAFLLKPSGPERVRQILEVEHRFPMDGGPMVGLSVSAGILSFKKDADGDRYFGALTAFINEKNKEGYRFLLIPHVQEKAEHNNDLLACLTVLRAVDRPADNVVLSTPLSASDFKGVIGHCVCLLGARTHATIASMSQGVPTVALAYSRKAWGIMTDYYGKDLAQKLTIDVAHISRDALSAAFEAAMSNGRTEKTAAAMQERARLNATGLEAACRKLGLA